MAAFIPSLSMGNPFPYPQLSLPPLPTFRAPAHKHAHHLHSIPPREKSTRTLILDHMLWVHARTRFAQARAELGMSDPTGGPSSPNYSHRRRPENYDEEDQSCSDGEDILHLKSRPTHDDDDESDYLSRQDLALARTLRLRAEGLESVISSMLDQPPPHHPIDDDTDDAGGAPPKSNHPHTLPNGVRLRLALGTIVNDLFARQVPPQPYRHTHPPNRPSEESPPHPHHTIPGLPDSLYPLVPLSGASIPLPHPSSSSYPLPYPNYSPSSIPIYNQHPHPHQHPHQHQHQHQRQHQHHRQRPIPSPRTTSFYTSGADPSTANSPPSLRCPRHLHTGCEICVEAKSSPSRHHHHHHNHHHHHLNHSKSNSPSTPIIKSPSHDPVAGNGSGPSSGIGSGSGGGGGGLSGWQDGTGVGSGLLRPGIKGNTLRRCIYDNTPSSSSSTTTTTTGGGGGGGRSTGTGTGNTKLSKLLPRFIRLSALVAVELGQEARDDADDDEGDGNQVVGGSEEDNGEENALRPTREWYMLLSGLLTRAVLEGYLTAGWRGTKPVECLLLVGIGITEGERREAFDNKGGNRDGKRDRSRVEEEEEEEEEDDEDDEDDEDGVDDVDEKGEGGDEQEFEQFDPDGLPTLNQAIKILFPSLKSSSSSSRRAAHAELEYEIEMHERLKRFYDIPESTPDLSTHMEDLAWSYPAEPVERAAVRFCEAVNRWRGKPELETYKKKSPSSPTTGMNINLDSIVHSNPSSPIQSNNPNTSYSLASLGSIMGPPPPPHPLLLPPHHHQHQPTRLTTMTTPPRGQRRQPSQQQQQQQRRPGIEVYFYGVPSPSSTSASFSVSTNSATTSLLGKRSRDERIGQGRDSEGVKRLHRSM